MPDNHAAFTLYRAAGFSEVDPALANEWNLPQPVDYVWLEHPVRQRAPQLRRHVSEDGDR